MRGANETLKVSGKLNNARVHSNRLNVTLLKSKSTETLVKIMLLAGYAAESLNCEVVLQGERDEIRVPVTAQQGRETGRLQTCPICKAVGVHGEGSLFWSSHKKKFECFNHECKVEGPSLDKLRKPHTYYTAGLSKLK